jgi:tyrosyl-tRNA synthetase
MAGRDLQAQFGQPPQAAVFMPLLVGLDGVQKMSKSLRNYVGITEGPDAMFGKLMSLPDHLMASYFELATDVGMGEVRTLLTAVADGSLNPKDAKRRLAREVVGIYHDQDAAVRADAEFERVHARHELPTDIPEFALPPDVANEGRVWICRLLTLAGLAKGTGEARRLVEQGGVHVGDSRIAAPDAEVALTDLIGAVVRVGTRRFVRIR